MKNEKKSKRFRRVAPDPTRRNAEGSQFFAPNPKNCLKQPKKKSYWSFFVVRENALRRFP